eukprot:c24790_g5_i2 orf=226-3333(+)
MEALQISKFPTLESELGSFSNPRGVSAHSFASPNPSLLLKDINASASVAGGTFIPTLPLTGARIPVKRFELIEDAYAIVDNNFESVTHFGEMCASKTKNKSLQDVTLVNDSISYSTVEKHTPKTRIIREQCHYAYALQREGTLISVEILCVLLHNCIANKDLVIGKHVHLLIISCGFDFIPELGDNLIRLFSSCRSLEEAHLLFCKIALPRVSTWYAIISAYAMHGEDGKAVELYTRMVQESILPNSFILTCVIKSCASLRALTKGELIHNHVIQLGLQFDMYVASSLIDFYAKCRSIQKAYDVFSTLPCKNVVIWSAMIDAYIQEGCLERALELFKEMQKEGVEPNVFTFSSLISACGNAGHLWQGMHLHDQFTQSGLELDSRLASTLIDMYAKCGNLTEAHEVFSDLSFQTLVCWNTLIAGYARNEHNLGALQAFEDMEKEGFRPNSLTLSCGLKACGNLGDIEKGKVIHDQIIMRGIDPDEYIKSSLIDMYCKCGRLDDAHKVFDFWPSKSIVSWGALMAGYLQHDLGLPVLDLFAKMQKEGIKPNTYIYSSALKACGSMADLKEGVDVHDQFRNSGLETCAFLGSSLIDMYAKCGNLEAAREVFEELPCRNIVCWGAMLAGYVQHGVPLSAFSLYEKMHCEGIKPDKVIYTSILEACGIMSSSGHGMVIHCQIISGGFSSDTVVGNFLVDMYIKCDCLDDAQYVFNALQHRNEVSWGAMVVAHAQHSNFSMTRQCLKGMVEEGFMPDEILFTDILSACRRSGQFKEGRKFFRLMREVYDIKPSIEHFGCMVNLLGEGGFLVQAEELLDILPIPPDSVAWLSCLAACRAQRNVELGLKCFTEVIRLDPGMGMAYVLMSSIYAEAGMLEKKHMIDDQRKKADAWKIPGRAWIEIDKEVHEFVVGDRTHPQSNKIYATLKRLAVVLKDEGHVLQQGVVGGAPPDVKEGGAALEDSNEEALLGHCEKLALAFGLLSTPEGATVRIVKNLRVCIDCHSATKIISRLERREIIINDAYHVHHFNDGECSCEQNLTSG